jgi:hypothetical protein
VLCECLVLTLPLACTCKPVKKNKGFRNERKTGTRKLVAGTGWTEGVEDQLLPPGWIPSPREV